MDLTYSLSDNLSCLILFFFCIFPQPEYKLADPICTYVFSVLVLFTTVRIIRDTGVIVLEGKGTFQGQTIQTSGWIWRLQGPVILTVADKSNFWLIVDSPTQYPCWTLPDLNWLCGCATSKWIVDSLRINSEVLVLIICATSGIQFRSLLTAFVVLLLDVVVA